MAEAMRAVGLDPSRVVEARRTDIGAFVELHIEQGRSWNRRVFLSRSSMPSPECGTEIVPTGVANHAGAFPMDLRRDPMAGFAEIVLGVIGGAQRMGRPAVTTVGRVSADPNGPAIIPRPITFTIDARHLDPVARDALYAAHEGVIREISARRGLEVESRVLFDQAPCISDLSLLETLERAAVGQRVPTLRMASGAGHDTQQMATAARRVAMVFVRSKDGCSHTPEEFSSLDDIVAGISVLAAGLHALAY